MSEYVEPQDLEDLDETEANQLESDPAFQKLLAKISLYKTKLEGSKFIEECYNSFDKIQLKVAHIRCLALGSPSQSNNSLYQLAFAELIAKNLNIPNISFYDPIFTLSDTYLLKTKLGHQVEANEPALPNTLLFLPHAPLELTNIILNQVKPHYLLGNDILSHTDRYTKAKLHEKYPTISLLVRLSEHNANNATEKTNKKDDLSQKAETSENHKPSKKDEPSKEDFTPIRRRRNKKNVFVEPKLDYDYSQTYFTDLSLYRYTNGFQKDSEWGNSFSDLALHIITPQSTEL